jgi:hypothetical protein
MRKRSIKRKDGNNDQITIDELLKLKKQFKTIAKQENIDLPKIKETIAQIGKLQNLNKNIILNQNLLPFFIKVRDNFHNKKVVDYVTKLLSYWEKKFSISSEEMNIKVEKRDDISSLKQEMKSVIRKDKNNVDLVKVKDILKRFTKIDLIVDDLQKNLIPFFNKIKEFYIKKGNEKLIDYIEKILNFWQKKYKLSEEEAKKLAKKAEVEETCYNMTETPLQCTIYKNVPLKEHQLRVCKFLDKHPKQKGLLLFHSVGSGKTITSITIIRCILEKNPNQKFFVITPKSLVENFKKELRKVRLINYFKDKVEIESHVKFINRIEKEGPEFCKDAILIIDEAHNFRTEMKKTRTKEFGKRTRILFSATQLVKKVFLLTATPLYNYPKDFANLFAMMSKNETSVKKLYTLLKQFDKFSMFKFSSQYQQLKHQFGSYISYFKNNDTENYPSISYKNIIMTMTDIYLDKYIAVEEDNMAKIPPSFNIEEKDLRAFYNGVRRATNNLDASITSAKVEWTVDHVIKNVKDRKKTLVYSNFLKSGINLIKQRLTEQNIKWVEIMGDKSIKQRKEALLKYNGTEKNKYLDNQVYVILISSAGSEGIDLKNTSSVVVMEPHWNNEKIKQIVGRAARYQSHIFLNKEEQTVNVFYLILEKPEIQYEQLDSVDRYLINLSEKKEKSINEFYKLLIDVSI